MKIGVKRWKVHVRREVGVACDAGVKLPAMLPFSELSVSIRRSAKFRIFELFPTWWSSIFPLEYLCRFSDLFNGSCCGIASLV